MVVLSGGNIDTTVLDRVIERALAEDNRLVKFQVSVSDRPGGITELTKLISDLGVRFVCLFVCLFGFFCFFFVFVFFVVVSFYYS